MSCLRRLGGSHVPINSTAYAYSHRYPMGVAPSYAYMIYHILSEYQKGADTTRVWATIIYSLSIAGGNVVFAI